MDEQLRIILIIIVSVSIFGLLVFVFVKNYVRQQINNLVEEENDKPTVIALREIAQGLVTADILTEVVQDYEIVDAVEETAETAEDLQEPTA